MAGANTQGSRGEPRSPHGLVALGVLTLSLALAGCASNEGIGGLLGGTGIDYQSARKGASLEVPPDLATPRGSDRFALPARSGETTFSEFERNRAAAAGTASAAQVLPSFEVGRVERDGDQRWLVVDMPPEQVWPLARQFWIDSGFGIAREAPQVGVLETTWAENRAQLPEDFIRRTIGRVFDKLYSTGERDKFRMRIEPAGKGSEIYVTHQGLREVYTSELEDSTGWEWRPSDPGLEAEFLRRLLVRLGATQEQSEQMMASTRPVERAEQARLIGSGPSATVRVDEPFDRAWRRVAVSLDRAGFTVEDRNRAEGLFFVRYLDPEVQNQPRGFFSRVFGGDPDAPDPRQFRIELRGEGQFTDVRVRDTRGEPVSGEIDQALASRILVVLRDELK